MLQNLKADIVYYKTNTDFEMEFNLCGCCRMRLLTDKAADKRTLVHALARAVSRSRVIIITGQLFGEEGIIEIAAHAIAKTATEIDNGKYGIKSAEKISIVNGATPLVTPDGIFAGCIIECGPQSMILLTDNKSVRKSVMTTLIHPYIEELYTEVLKPKAENPAPPTAEAPAEAEFAFDTPAETDDISSVSAEDAAPALDGERVDDAQVAAPEYTETEEAEEQPIEPEEEEPDNENERDSENVKEQANENEPSEPLNAFASKPSNTVVSGGMSFTEAGTSAPDNIPEVFLEPEPLGKLRREKYIQPYSFNSSESFVFGNDDYPKSKGFISSGNLPILILSVLLLIILAVVCYCVFYVPEKAGISAAAYLQETFSTLFG